MDNKLKTGLISLVALVGGYSFFTKNFNKPFEADTFMASSGKKRPVAMRANKIKLPHLIESNWYSYREGETTASKKYLGDTEKIFKNSIPHNDFSKYLTDDQNDEFIGMGFSRYATHNFQSIFSAISHQMKTDYANMLLVKYYNFLRRDSKIFLLLCNKIAERFEALSAQGLTKEADILNDSKLKQSLESLFNFMNNLKIPYWVCELPFAKYGSVSVSKNTHLFNAPFNALTFLKYVSNTPYSLDGYWDGGGGKEGYGRKIEEFSAYNMLPVSIKLQAPLNEYAKELSLDESALKQLGEYYLENDYQQRYQQILIYIDFFKANPTIKYIAKTHNKGPKCYDGDVANLNEYDKIKGLQDGYGQGVLIKRWDNELMSEIFTEEKLDVLLGLMTIKLKKIATLVNRKANVAGNRQEKLLGSVEGSNKESIINALNDYFSNPDAEHFKQGISAPRAYLSLSAKVIGANLGMPTPHGRLEATIQEVRQKNSDGKYEIHKREGVYFHELSNYGVDLANDITISKDLKDMVLEEVNTHFKYSIKHAKEKVAKAQSALRGTELNYDKYIKILN